MTIEYRLTADQLSTTVDNTIRVLDEYSLRKKPDGKGRQVIMDRGWMGIKSPFCISQRKISSG